MTIYVDGANPPVLIQRISDRVFVSVDATGSDNTDAALVEIVSSDTTVWVNSDDAAKGIKLVGGEIGDIVLFLRPSGGEQFHVYRPNGTELSSAGVGLTSYYTPNGW
jgi:hypothetical protein